MFYIARINHSTEELERLLPKYINSSRSENTIKRYDHEWKQFQRWATEKKLPALPTKNKHVSLYLVHLLENQKTSHKVQGVVYAIKWKHETNGLSNPISLLSKRVVESALRTAKPTRKPKEPITTEMLQQIFTYINGDNAHLKHYRTFTIMLMSFVGFFRFNEVINLRLSDICFYDDYMSVFLGKSKTDIYREGNKVLISRLESQLCPVKVIKNYITKGRIVRNEEFLFRSVTWRKTNGSYRLKNKNKPISYSTTRHDMLDMLTKIGLDPNLYGLHSARSGGATSAANLGVRDRLFQRHGRWKSTQAKDSYVKDDINRLKSVSKSLGL